MTSVPSSVLAAQWVAQLWRRFGARLACVGGAATAVADANDESSASVALTGTVLLHWLH